MGADLGSSRGRRRADRAGAAVGQARREITSWLGARREDPLFVRFGPHLRVLDAVLGRNLAALDDRVGELATRPADGACYDGCRAVEEMLTVVRRTFTWYRERYDQRLDPRLGPVLLAADELVRSCWTQPFAVLHRPAGQGPLTYLDPRFNAFALTRTALPAELRPPARTDAVDDAVRALLRELPITTIALPEWTTREAWWLALAAHETGHLVVRDLTAAGRHGDGRGSTGATAGGWPPAGGVADATQAAISAAVTTAEGGGTDLAEQWSGWHGELFADAFAVVMVADAAAWTVDELEHGGPGRLSALSPPGYPYPPPLVRRALLAELTRRVHRAPGGLAAQPDVRAVDPGAAGATGATGAAGIGGAAGAGGAGGAGAQAEEWLAAVGGTQSAVELRRHLAVVPAVAQALLGVSIDGHSLLDLGGVGRSWYGPRGRVTAWATALRRDPVPITGAALRARPAARLLIQAGVAAQLTASPDNLGDLHHRLLPLLRNAGPVGTLAAQPIPPPDLDDLAGRLSRRLLDGTLAAQAPPGVGRTWPEQEGGVR